MSATEDVDVVVVGAGMAGLACARRLAGGGRSVALLEAGAKPGGRVATEEIDGFRCDRGFQILLTDYPEARAQLDYDALDLARFDPGALVALDGRLHPAVDPLRAPTRSLDTLRAPVGSPLDKARLAALVARVRLTRPADLLRGEDRSTADELAAAGFSSAMTERFFQPLFAGIGLDPDLSVSARFFRVVLRMLATGDAAVPADGMGTIATQLAGRLDDGVLRCGTEVTEIEGTTAVLASGDRVRGGALVVATEGPVAAQLLGLPAVASAPAAAVWFAGEEAPMDDRLIVLDGDGTGPATNVAVMSNVAPTYAPPGRALTVASVVGARASVSDDRAREDRELVTETLAQLGRWFGPRVRRWEPLVVQRISHGHPDQRPPLHPKQRVALGEGVFVCGDHRDTASIQGALYSGRRCAEAVMGVGAERAA